MSSLQQFGDIFQSLTSFEELIVYGVQKKELPKIYTILLGLMQTVEKVKRSWDIVMNDDISDEVFMGCDQPIWEEFFNECRHSGKLS